MIIIIITGIIIIIIIIYLTAKSPQNLIVKCYFLKYLW